MRKHLFKKIIFTLSLCFIMLCFIPFKGVFAEDTTDGTTEGSSETPGENAEDGSETLPDAEISTTNCDILNFQFKVSPTLSDYVVITLSWVTLEKMENLVIMTYYQSLDEYVETFNMAWDLDNLDEDTWIKFYEIEPIEDPLDPEETIEEEQYYVYTLKYHLDTDELGTLKLSFKYNSLEKDYQSIVFVPAGIPHKEYSSSVSTKKAIFAAVVSVGMSIIGTILIVFAFSRGPVKDIEDIED